MFYDDLHVDIPLQGGNNRADRVIRILFIIYIYITYRLQYYNGPGGPDLGRHLRLRCLSEGHMDTLQLHEPTNNARLHLGASVDSKAFEAQHLPNPGAEACPQCRNLHAP